MQTCPGCRALVHEQASECPACDLRLKPRNWVWLWLVIVALVAAIVTWLVGR
jgi:RNA polymerase subunit RPABC4/transcription elongation factor Spt4